MATCATCSHPQRKAIESKLREGIPQGLVSLWTKENEPYVSRNALGRHSRDHMGISTGAGRKPLSTDIYEAVRDRTLERMETGELEPSITHGLQAQRFLDERSNRLADRDLVARITAALTGQLPDRFEPDDEIEGEFWEARREFAALLPGGENDLDDVELRQHDRATVLARLDARAKQ